MAGPQYWGITKEKIKTFLLKNGERKKKHEQVYSLENLQNSITSAAISIVKNAVAAAWQWIARKCITVWNSVQLPVTKRELWLESLKKAI